MEVVDLHARTAKTGDCNERRFADTQHGADRQQSQRDSASRDVFADIARADAEPAGANLFEKLGRHKVHLAKVRLCRVLCYP